MSDEAIALVREFIKTKSIATACDACELINKEMQE